MITNGNFYGEIAGRNIYSFLGELNYELQTSEERIEHLKKVLYTEQGYPHPFFERLFEQTKDEDTGLNSSYVKLILNTTDTLYTDTNIAEVLRKMADYVLFSKDAKELEKRDNVQYRIFKDANLFKKINREVSIDGMFDGAVESGGDVTIDDVIDILVKESNMVKEKGTKVMESDFKDEEIGSILGAYQSFINRLRARLKQNKEHIELIENIETFNEETCEMLKEAGLDLHNFAEARELKANLARENKYLIRNIGSAREDMVDVKRQLKKPIEFKSPLSGHAEPCYDGMDFGDAKHIAEVITLPDRETYNLQDDYEIIQYEVKELMKRINLTEIESRLIELLKDGWSQRETAIIINREFGFDEEDGYTQQKVSETILRKIAPRLAEAYRSHEKELRVANGELTIQTKVCKKCNEEKSVEEFHREGSGYKSVCKSCRKKQ